MSYSISTLLLRNLSDVFGEKDPARRRSGWHNIAITSTTFGGNLSHHHV
jgi:hypothetical protein